MKKNLLIFLTVITFPALAQLSNGNFEDTTALSTGSTSYVNRGGWYMGGAAYKVSPDSHSGNYAFSIWNWYYYAPGQLFNDAISGNTNPSGVSAGGIPTTQKPVQLSGFYKYVPGNNGGYQNDSATVIVMAKRWNTTLNRRDTVAFGLMRLKQTAGYIPFTLNIFDKMPGINPDTVFIGFWSCNRYDGGNCNCTSASGGYCLYLTVDDLTLSTPTGIKSVMDQFSAVNVYPNPASTSVTVDLSKLPARSTLLWYNALGCEVMKQEDVEPAKLKIDRDNLPAGIYYLRVYTAGEVIYKASVVLH